MSKVFPAETDRIQPETLLNKGVLFESSQGNGEVVGSVWKHTSNADGDIFRNLSIQKSIKWHLFAERQREGRARTRGLVPRGREEKRELP